MKNLALSLIFFSTTALSSGLLLKKHAVSGLMIPENSFEKDCSVFSSGMVRLRIREGINPPRTTRKLISQRQVGRLRELLREARRGQVTETDVICDAGTRTVYGYLRGQRILIDEDLDCQAHRRNTSTATGPILRMGQRICEFY